MFVFDRNGEGVPAARVDDITLNSGRVFSRHLEEHGALARGSAFTDRDGEASIPMEGNHRIGFVRVTRSGYAPTIQGPISPGFRYEVFLDLGSPQLLECTDADGVPIPFPEVHVRYTNPTIDFFVNEHLGGEWRLTGTEEGAVILPHTPMGMVEVFGFEQEGTRRAYTSFDLCYSGPHLRGPHSVKELVFEEPEEIPILVDGARILPDGVRITAKDGWRFRNVFDAERQSLLLPPRMKAGTGVGLLCLRVTGDGFPRVELLYQGKERVRSSSRCPGRSWCGIGFRT